MSWIDTIAPGDAEGPLAELYARCVDPASGEVDHILRIHSLHPAGLEAHLALYTAVMRGTASLPKRDRELVALRVSQLNACHY